MNWKKALVAAPLVAVALLIVFTQIYFVSPWISAMKANNGSSSSTQLQVLGYTYSRDLVQLSVTLYNKGDTSLTLTQVFYDEEELTQGIVGAALDSMTAGNNITSNDLIFPAANSWNMDTGGPSTPIIQAHGIVTMYLGVTSSELGTTHPLQVVTEEKSFVFYLLYQGS